MNFIPLHLSPLDQLEDLKPWVESWLQAEDSHWFELQGWFVAGHQWTNCILTPPPVAADATLEQLGRVLHKCLHTTHIVIVPHLMTAQWWKQLGKLCDLVFSVPVGTPFWNASQHEPLVLGISLPLISHRPWQLWGTPYVEQIARMLQDLSLTDHQWGSNILWQFYGCPKKLDTMPGGLVWEMLQQK